jgi:hypothetical protein
VPVTQNISTPPAGWYPDPATPGTIRYFDGRAWTPHVGPAPQAAAGVGAHPSDPLHWLVPTGRTGQSIAAGYVAIFAMFIWVLGPVALGLGVWALRRSGTTGGHGRGRAWFAVVVGVLTTLAALWTAAAMLTS